MNESLVKYLAGLLDADGSLSFNFKRDQNRVDRHFVSLTLKLSASDAIDVNKFIDSLPDLTGFGSIYKEGRNQQFKNWTVTKRSDLEMLIPRLTKHMVIKAKHWDWILGQWRDLRKTSVSDDERKKMTNQSKISRLERVGPLKPKNHPTWAWLAGYLDGDGCYSYRRYTVNGYSQWTINVTAVAHINDISVLEFLQRSFGGSIIDQGQSDSVKIWRRSLGYQNRSFAENFLPNLAKHSRLKRHKIDVILSHHRQRLSVSGAKAQATV